MTAYHIMLGYPPAAKRERRSASAATDQGRLQEGVPGRACERSQDQPRAASPRDERLEPGDVLMVTRLDRLARSTRDLLNALAAIMDKKAGFCSLTDTWADTTTSHGRLMLTVLGGLAEFERDLIRTRTGEGRERAVARGVKMGRPLKLTPHQQKEAIKRRDAGDESLADIGRSYNVSGATISRL
jgi:DNA invertase Pin-like site-specific DNA recombinase